MSDPVTRLNAALEGRYTIESKLGEGGMTTVYLAEDIKHNRKVALKVLKPELAAVVGAERFLTEIQVTANLQHPHILPLFVGVLERTRDLRRKSYRLIHRKLLLAVDPVAEGFAFHVGHHIKEKTLRFTGVV